MHYQEILLDLFKLLLEVVGEITLDNVIDLFAHFSLFTFPVLMLFGIKLNSRRVNMLNGNINMWDKSDELYAMYIKKTLSWVLMCFLYGLSIFMLEYPTLKPLSSPTAFVSLGFSWGLISVEIRFILDLYRRFKSKAYIPAFKRVSFWLFLIASTFKVIRLTSGETFGTPEQIMSIIDLSTYLFIFLSFFVFFFFDRRKNIIHKAITKSNRIVNMLLDNVNKSEKMRRKIYRDIDHVIDLLSIAEELCYNKEEEEAIKQNKKKLEVLKITSQRRNN